MDLAAFRRSLAAPAPPAGLSLALRALWLDAHGDWQGAHDAAQADEGGDGDWGARLSPPQGGRCRQCRLLVSPRSQAGRPRGARRGMV